MPFDWTFLAVQYLTSIEGQKLFETELHLKVILKWLLCGLQDIIIVKFVFLT
jgi:hypothetical protein